MRAWDPDRPVLLIPGPTEVDPAVATGATVPMISHRGPEITDLLEATLPRVGRMLGTRHRVLPLGCSATGAMEGAIRNAAGQRFLHLVCGAFSERWSDIRAACGEEGDKLAVGWGEANSPAAVADALRRRDYGAVTLVHNETSTGVLNPLPEIAEAIRSESPDTLLLVDTVSSMAAVALDLDAWGVDLCLAGTQKAWAMSAGLTLCAVSDRALERSDECAGKGFYFDWRMHAASLDRGQTPSTPPISLLQQLRVQLDRIDAEGLDARYARHRAMRDRTLQWAAGRFEPFAVDGHRSPTVSALSAPDLDIAAWRSRLRRRGLFLGSGYGQTKETVFRVGHMGEWDLPALDRALALMDEELEVSR